VVLRVLDLAFREGAKVYFVLGSGMGTGWMRRDENLTSRERYAFQFFHQWPGCYTIFVVLYGFHWSGEFTPQRSRARLFSKRIYLAWPALLYLVPDFPRNVQTISSPSPTESNPMVALLYSIQILPVTSPNIHVLSPPSPGNQCHIRVIFMLSLRSLQTTRTTATLIESLLAPSNLLRLFLALPIHSLYFGSLFVAFSKTLRSSRRSSSL
jgi:hypothetical protein